LLSLVVVAVVATSHLAAAAAVALSMKSERQ
jgi:hypothetical protein